MPLVWQNQFLIKMKKTISIIIIALILGSCSIFGSLHSTTTIKPNDSFVLGNNEHGSFKVVLKNISNHELKIFMTPISGGSHSPSIVVPNETIKVKADKNTALIIENKSSEQADVTLKVTGDIGLSMGYKN
jgi:PBP1b-binding outer membrane lipoprotein LpoB